MAVKGIRYKPLKAEEVTLFHFTRKDSITAIREKGLCLTVDYDRMAAGVPRIWLTARDNLNLTATEMLAFSSEDWTTTWMLDAEDFVRLTVHVPGLWVTHYLSWIPKQRRKPRIKPYMESLMGEWFLCFRRIPVQHIEFSQL